jgi:hypothetical protein
MDSNEHVEVRDVKLDVPLTHSPPQYHSFHSLHSRGTA